MRIAENTINDCGCMPRKHDDKASARKFVRPQMLVQPDPIHGRGPFKTKPRHIFLEPLSPRVNAFEQKPNACRVALMPADAQKQDRGRQWRIRRPDAIDGATHTVSIALETGSGLPPSSFSNLIARHIPLHDDRSDDAEPVLVR
jgi:hypothetical protein